MRVKGDLGVVSDYIRVCEKGRQRPWTESKKVLIESKYSFLASMEECGTREKQSLTRAEGVL